MTMENKKTTSSRIASLAAEILNDDNASAIAKKLAGSALSQANKGSETSVELEKLASEVLKSDKYSAVTKELAGSVLAQANK